MRFRRAWFRLRNRTFHTDAMLGFFVGILIGAATAGFPLIPYALPDSAATLIGAALGAAIAVLGARLISERGDRKYSIDLINAVEETGRPLLDAGQELFDLVFLDEGRSRHMHSGHAVRLGKVSDLAKRARAELAQLKPAFDRKPDFLLRFVRLDKAIAGYSDALDKFRRDDRVRSEYNNHIAGGSALFPPPPWSGEIPTAVSTGELRVRLQDVEWSLQAIDRLV